MGEVPLSQAAAVGCDPTSSSCTGKWQTWSGLANSLVTPQCPQGRSHSWPQFTLENWKLREQAPTSQPASCGGIGAPLPAGHTCNLQTYLATGPRAPAKCIPMALLHPGGDCLSQKGGQGNRLATAHFPFSLIQLLWLNLVLLEVTF